MSPQAHKSFFSYSLSRPYPYKWFTPIAAVCLVLFTAAFSALNFYSTGFEQVVTVSNNPNSTVNEDAGLRRWPSFIFNQRPTCQAMSIPVNSQVFTNQTALIYTITAIWQDPDGGPEILPALSYFNNVLENCSVASIEIDLDALGRSGNQIGYAEWGETVRSYVTCSIQTPSGPVLFNLTQEYDYVPDDIPLSEMFKFLGTNFLTRDKESRASLWWGESLMSTYWAYVSGAMQNIRENQTANGQYGISKGTILFSQNVSLATDITTLAFFDVDFRFIVDGPGGEFGIIDPGDYFPFPYNNSGPFSVATLDAMSAYPNIWSLVDRFAKSVYSTILSDLGQKASSNILTNAAVLQNFTAPFGTSTYFYANAWPGPAVQDYDSLQKKTGPLGGTPSVINGEYLCQIPKRKSTGNLLVSILVADLVLLQVVWKCYSLAVDWFFLKTRRRAQYCEGCALLLNGGSESARSGDVGRRSDEVELRMSRPASSSKNIRTGHRALSEQSLLSSFMG